MNPLIMFILDGAADVPSCKSYRESPLAKARTPGLDRLARNGHAGLLFPIDEGVEPETHSGMLNLLGYNVKPEYVPRGPIEALGCGMNVREGDLVLRVNFGTSDKTGLIVDRRVCRSLTLEEADRLCEDIVNHIRSVQTDFELEMRVVREYRACAVLRYPGIPLSAQITNTDPGYPTEKVRLTANGGLRSETRPATPPGTHHLCYSLHEHHRADGE